MSSAGGTGSSGGGLGALSSLLAQGDAVGGQAQFAQFLQLITKIVEIMTGLNPPAQNSFLVTDWTGGNLDIAADLPTLTTATISLKPGSPGPLSVVLPNTNGPWFVADGSGFCSPANQVTITVAGGGTIANASAFALVEANQGAIFVRDGANYLVF